MSLVLALACGPSVVAVTAKPSYCLPPERDALQQITTTPASPYLVHHSTADTYAGTVVFLPGGSGVRRNAQRAWDGYLADADGAARFRVVIPYWPDVEMTEDARRTLAVLDEVLACYGGETKPIHLAGFSNGGHVAFDLMLEHPERFATLLGAPGEFAPGTTVSDLMALRGKAVFNGIGERDDEFWHKGVRDAHTMLTAAGVESSYVEFRGQGHGAGLGFPKDELFAFWLAHSPGVRP